MTNNKSGIVIILILVSMYLLGKYLPDTPKETYNHIPPPSSNLKQVVGYDYKNQRYLYTSGQDDKPLDLGIIDNAVPSNPQKTEVIYIESNRPMTKKEFEYMVEDYIHDNWDDLRDKFDN